MNPDDKDDPYKDLLAWDETEQRNGFLQQVSDETLFRSAESVARQGEGEAMAKLPREPKHPPKFVPGDLVEVKVTTWPPKSNNVIKTTGLYEEIGYPLFASGNADTEMTTGNHTPPGMTWKERDRKLNEKLAGTCHVGDRCLVVAVSYHEGDGKWYYLLNNNKPRGFGWTRCGFRLEKV